LHIRIRGGFVVELYLAYWVTFHAPKPVVTAGNTPPACASGTCDQFALTVSLPPGDQTSMPYSQYQLGRRNVITICMCTNPMK